MADVRYCVFSVVKYPVWTQHHDWHRRLNICLYEVDPDEKTTLHLNIHPKHVIWSQFCFFCSTFPSTLCSTAPPERFYSTDYLGSPLSLLLVYQFQSAGSNLSGSVGGWFKIPYYGEQAAGTLWQQAWQQNGGPLTDLHQRSNTKEPPPFLH